MAVIVQRNRRGVMNMRESTFQLVAVGVIIVISATLGFWLFSPDRTAEPTAIVALWFAGLSLVFSMGAKLTASNIARVDLLVRFAERLAAVYRDLSEARNRRDTLTEDKRTGRPEFKEAQKEVWRSSAACLRLYDEIADHALKGEIDFDTVSARWRVDMTEEIGRVRSDGISTSQYIRLSDFLAMPVEDGKPATPPAE